MVKIFAYTNSTLFYQTKSLWDLSSPKLLTSINYKFTWVLGKLFDWFQVLKYKQNVIISNHDAVISAAINEYVDILFRNSTINEYVDILFRITRHFYSLPWSDELTVFYCSLYVG